MTIIIKDNNMLQQLIKNEKTAMAAIVISIILAVVGLSNFRFFKNEAEKLLDINTNQTASEESSVADDDEAITESEPIAGYDPSVFSCSETSDSNVARIGIHGEIGCFDYYNECVDAEEAVELIEGALIVDSLKAILLSIDSPGGNAPAAEEIANAIQRSEKPIVAVIKSSGTSAAYMIASAADYIFAGRLSDVGGIAVNWSYTDIAKQNAKEGITYNQLTTGKFKDIGDENKPLTEEERQAIMEDLLKTHDIFVEIVANNRKLPKEHIAKLADGFTLMGDDALKAGLIDQVGYESDAKNWLSEKIGEKVNVCDYPFGTED